jgi:hypothetical protein
MSIKDRDLFQQTTYYCSSSLQYVYCTITTTYSIHNDHIIKWMDVFCSSTIAQYNLLSGTYLKCLG